MIESFVHYLKNTEQIDPSQIRSIFDVGARDCQQSIALANEFQNANVYAFEANPQTIPLCRANIQSYSKVHLIEGAVNIFNGEVDFFPIDPKETKTTWADGNPGASSLFKANGEYPLELYVQTKVRVPCHRLDKICSDYKIESVDILWMDLQGAELLALQSLGAQLKKIKYIFTEVSFRPIYHGQCLFPDLHQYLTVNNFSLSSAPKMNQWQDDVIYKNNLVESQI